MGGYSTGETARMGSNQMKYKKHTLKDEHFLLTCQVQTEAACEAVLQIQVNTHITNLLSGFQRQ